MASTDCLDNQSLGIDLLYHCQSLVFVKLVFDTIENLSNSLKGLRKVHLKHDFIQGKYLNHPIKYIILQLKYYAAIKKNKMKPKNKLAFYYWRQKESNQQILSRWYFVSKENCSILSMGIIEIYLKCRFVDIWKINWEESY